MNFPQARMSQSLPVFFIEWFWRGHLLSLHRSGQESGRWRCSCCWSVVRARWDGRICPEWYHFSGKFDANCFCSKDNQWTHRITIWCLIRARTFACRSWRGSTSGCALRKNLWNHQPHSTNAAQCLAPVWFSFLSSIIRKGSVPEKKHWKFRCNSINDIHDNSRYRQGAQWPKIYISGVAQTINSANHSYSLSQKELFHLKNWPATLQIFNEEIVHLHQGQGIDLYWRDTLKPPTQQQHVEIVPKKKNRAPVLPRIPPNAIAFDGSTRSDPFAKKPRVCYSRSTTTLRTLSWARYDNRPPFLSTPLADGLS